MLSLIPMAGGGRRFSQAGYRLPKPFIPIMGQPMFVAAISSFPPADRFVFICLEQFLQRYPFAEETRKYFRNSAIVSVPEVTDGQACTCLLAEKHIRSEEELLISSIDYQIIYDHAAWDLLAADKTVDVVIFTFQMGSVCMKDPAAFAFCRTDGDRVTEVVEKRIISDRPEYDPAVVGTFYYRRSGDFIDGARAMIDKNVRVNNEFYVGTSINEVIARGKNVRIFPVEKFISFGDPLELQLYQAWEDFFFHEESHPYSGWQQR